MMEVSVIPALSTSLFNFVLESHCAAQFIFNNNNCSLPLLVFYSSVRLHGLIADSWRRSLIAVVVPRGNRLRLGASADEFQAAGGILLR